MAKETKYGTKKKWIVGKRADDEVSAKIASGLGLHPATARLLSMRGCKTADDAESFIRKSSGQLHDPYLLPDIKKASEKIREAVRDKRKIVIYGDYDVDGVTSVSVLYLYLTSLGACVSYYIPKRSEEGYGMSCDVIRRMIDEDGAGLIITVDTGITAIDEIKLARDLGCDVVVTDHHECREILPDACAVVNPQRRDSEYPFRELAGVGVVYKLICALEYEISGSSMEEAVMLVSEKYIDLVAIGTVADVMPVLDENRLIVSYGLSKIQKSERCGLKALIDASTVQSPSGKTPRKTRITSSYISYTIAPRINAAGRISDASIAVELFLTNDEKRAAELAETLCRVNRERQSLENVIAEEAYAKVEEMHDFEKDSVIVLDDEGWHNGIIGIVASRVTEKYGCPSILISYEGYSGDPSDQGKGSGRSIKGFNLVEALGECGEYLEKYGGHELAAGLTVRRDMLPQFRRAINEAAARRQETGSYEPSLTADDMLDESEISLGLAEELLLLEPFGVGNPTPLYITNGLRVVSVSGVGSNKHTRLIFSGGGENITGMCFSCSPEELDIHQGEMVDVMYNLDINEFRGERTVQLIIRDIHKSDGQLMEEQRERELFEKILACSAPCPIDYRKYIPNREEFGAVYRILRHEISMGRNRVSLRAVVDMTNELLPMNYVKLRIVIEILTELEILYVKNGNDDVITVYTSSNGDKKQLESSSILKRLHTKYKS